VVATFHTQSFDPCLIIFRSRRKVFQGAADLFRKLGLRLSIGCESISELSIARYALRPAHSRCHLIVTRIPKASASSLPP
jgi:hypothetical protein